MSAQNQNVATWVRSQGTNFATRGQVTANAAVLHKLIVNSHTTGTFRLANGTSTSLSFVQGTYTPATGSSVIEFESLEFPNGIFVETGGTINWTAIYNELV